MLSEYAPNASKLPSGLTIFIKVSLFIGVNPSKRLNDVKGSGVISLPVAPLRVRLKISFLTGDVFAIITSAAVKPKFCPSTSVTSTLPLP